MSKIRKIGIFGGTFNPVHNGHIHLAQLCFDKLLLEKLIVIPTNISPHKKVEYVPENIDRVNMLKLAFEDYPYVTVSDIELRLGGKSYTVNTLCELKKIYPEDELFLIVGGDMFLCFESWKEYRKILSMCKVCTAPREKDEYVLLKDYQKKIDPSQSSTIVLNSDVLRISSSEIREILVDIHNSDNCLMPEKVRQYIIQKGLYKNG